MGTTRTRISILAAVAALLAAAVALSVFRDGPADAGAASEDRKAVPAPIESASVATLESDPPQYLLTVVSAQPSGCHEYEAATVTGRDGNTIRVWVTNTVPDNIEVIMCTMVYKTMESSLNLGSDFVSGETYFVDVNGTVIEFTAQ